MRTALPGLCALVLMCGCSSEPQADPLPPVPSAMPTTETLALPSEAAQATPQGAVAFTKFFFAEVNRGYVLLDPSPVKALSAGDCNSCKSIVEDIERLRGAALKVDGERFRLEFAEAPPVAEDGSAIVDFRFDADPYVEAREDGQVVRRLPGKRDQDGQAKLLRRGSEWIMSGLRLVAV